MFDKSGKPLEVNPLRDLRVRQAISKAIDREAIVKLLNGQASVAKGQLDPTSPWFGKPKFDIKYDLAEAKKLMAEAGYSKAKPLKAKVIIAQGGNMGGWSLYAHANPSRVLGGRRATFRADTAWQPGLDGGTVLAGLAVRLADSR